MLATKKYYFNQAITYQSHNLFYCSSFFSFLFFNDYKNPIPTLNSIERTPSTIIVIDT